MRTPPMFLSVAFLSVFQVLETLGLSGSLVPGSLDSGSKFVGLRR